MRDSTALQHAEDSIPGFTRKESGWIHKCTHDSVVTITEIPDDSALIAENCTVKEIVDSALMLHYNKIYFHTSNKAFNLALKSWYQKELAEKTKLWKETLQDQEPNDRSFEAWYEYNLTYLDERYVSFSISNSEYTGGVHVNAYSYYKNFTVENGKLKEIKFRDLFSPAFNPDSMSLDLNTGEIISERRRLHIDSACHFCHPTHYFSYYFENDSAADFEDVTFSFHTKGIRIKYTSTYPPMNPETIDGKTDYALNANRLIFYDQLQPYLDPKLPRW